MTCEEAERAIPWLLDDELEADVSLEVERHVGECAACQRALEREGRLRLTLRRATGSVAAPASLRRSVREAIERERRTTSPWVRAWPAAAAAAILIAFIWKGGSAGSSGDLEAIAERHARDLPMDVVAADVGKVQDYFNGKLPFSVRLPRLGLNVSQLGGRVTHLRDRDAAYVRYDLARGRLSVFVYEDPGEDFSEVQPLYQFGNQRMVVRQVHGYTVARWSQAGLVYSMVTDLPAQDVNAVLRGSAMW